MSAEKTNGKIAIIRLRGPVKVAKVVNDTLYMLRLRKKNICVIVEDTPSIRGMIEKVKAYVTFGTIDDETAKLLEDKKGKDVKFYHLNNPIKGFGRKGIKVPFALGGAYGDRKADINDLIKRMLL
ncbi:uL30 family ribosomal protein [Candidatus Woesearchaeota archaeon]|nr:uL30 family ribosomal protein [Candidatus Woesearchaeota archaeon]